MKLVTQSSSPIVFIVKGGCDEKQKFYTIIYDTSNYFFSFAIHSYFTNLVSYLLYHRFQHKQKN